MRVYAAMWCDCVYESGYTPISLHKTKRGAFKALLKYRYDLWAEDRESELLSGYKNDYAPTYHKSWTIKEFLIEE